MHPERRRGVAPTCPCEQGQQREDGIAPFLPPFLLIFISAGGMCSLEVPSLASTGEGQGWGGHRRRSACRERNRTAEATRSHPDLSPHAGEEGRLHLSSGISCRPSPVREEGEEGRVGMRWRRLEVRMEWAFQWKAAACPRGSGVCDDPYYGKYRSTHRDRSLQIVSQFSHDRRPILNDRCRN